VRKGAKFKTPKKSQKLSKGEENQKYVMQGKGGTGREKKAATKVMETRGSEGEKRTPHFQE